jgi:hypothetical protein
MDLREAISNLSALPEQATLFVERIEGRFRPESRVFVLELTDDELGKPVKSVAGARAPGAEYFLEVFIAREVVDGWRENHHGRAPTVDQALESITYYAENDAYPSSFFQ